METPTSWPTAGVHAVRHELMDVMPRTLQELVVAKMKTFIVCSLRSMNPSL